jgi:folate-binding protein YgfZ
MAREGQAPYIGPNMSSRAILPLPSRALVKVSGSDARPFLHGLLTLDVAGLGSGDLGFGALLTPQGRLLFDLFAYGLPDGVLLDVQREWREALMARLAMYRLRARVEIAADEGAVRVCLGSAPPVDEWVRDPRLPGLGFRDYCGAMPGGDGGREYLAHCLALGVPGPADWGTDKTYPIEANFDLLGGIDFDKGCFVGQETTSRMKRRGQVKSRMLPIAFEGPPPPHGTEILAGTLRAGEVLSGLDGRAMALVRLDRIEGSELTAGGKPVRIERPAWFSAAI